MPSFTITSSIADAEWDEICRLREVEGPDSLSGDMAFYFLLQGYIQVTHGEQQLFPKHALEAEVARVQANRAANPDAIPFPDDAFANLVLDKGVKIEVFDLAWQLDDIFVRQRFLDAPGTTEMFYSRSEGGTLSISFIKQGDTVRVSSDWSDGIVLPVSPDDLSAGVLRFLRDFAAEIQNRCPGLFDWEEFAPLRDYRTRPNGNGRPGPQRAR